MHDFSRWALAQGVSDHRLCVLDFNMFLKRFLQLLLPLLLCYRHYLFIKNGTQHDSQIRSNSDFDQKSAIVIVNGVLFLQWLVFFLKKRAHETGCQGAAGLKHRV